MLRSRRNRQIGKRNVLSTSRAFIDRGSNALFAVEIVRDHVGIHSIVEVQQFLTKIDTMLKVLSTCPHSDYTSRHIFSLILQYIESSLVKGSYVTWRRQVERYKSISLWKGFDCVANAHINYHVCNWTVFRPCNSTLFRIFLVFAYK
ncbi:Protein of unknown function [Gryllus bimaculatus]|nr:Protein of unknown function [Gryllus bimaculatus]